MKELRSLLIILMISEANFRTLHWMAAGNKFARMHADADEWRSMVSTDIDVVAEFILRRSDDLPSLKVVAANTNMILDTNGNTIDYDKFISITKSIFKNILNAITLCLESSEMTESENVGIKAALEGLYDKYDLQANYLVRRRESD